MRVPLPDPPGRAYAEATVRTSARRSPGEFIREFRLSRPERAAARSERLAEAAIRRERDNEETAERRAAAIEAERRRWGGGRQARGGGI